MVHPNARYPQARISACCSRRHSFSCWRFFRRTFWEAQREIGIRLQAAGFEMGKLLPALYSFAAVHRLCAPEGSRVSLHATVKGMCQPQFCCLRFCNCLGSRGPRVSRCRQGAMFMDDMGDDVQEEETSFMQRRPETTSALEVLWRFRALEIEHRPELPACQRGCLSMYRPCASILKLQHDL